MAGRYTEAQKRASMNYRKNLERMEAWASPEKKALYKELAQQNDMSLAKYIVTLLDRELEKSKSI